MLYPYCILALLHFSLHFKYCLNFFKISCRFLLISLANGDFSLFIVSNKTILWFCLTEKLKCAMLNLLYFSDKRGPFYDFWETHQSVLSEICVGIIDRSCRAGLRGYLSTEGTRILWYGCQRYDLRRSDHRRRYAYIRYGLFAG